VTTEPTAVYTWNTEHNTFVATVEDKECFIGTSGTFDTFSCNTMDKVANSYVAHLYGEGGETPSEPEKPVEKPATLAEQIAAANKLANKEFLPYESTITGTITDDPMASSKNEGSYKFTVSDGTNTLLCYFVSVTGGTPKKGDTVTVTGKLTAYNGTAQFSEGAATAVLAGGSETPSEPEKPVEPETPATDADAVITFEDASNRTVMTTTQQVWVANGITVTNDQANSTSELKDYVAPVRFYAHTSLTIQYTGMKTIKITCNTEGYATSLKDSISGEGVTVTADGNVVTITFATAQDSFVIADLVKQVRVDKIEIYK
jgi:hypothetical protein